MLFSETTLRRVFATTTAATVGVVEDLIVDPRGPAIAALRIDGARNGDTLHWPDIIRVGPDAVTVAGTDVVREAEGRTAELWAGEYRILGKRLLDEAGDDLGRIMDVDFDRRTGSIRELITTGGRVVGDRLFGCGRYAAVVLAGSPWTLHDNPMAGLVREPGHPVLR
jgi:sporulation protein YlmC with PRC-barrel domain